MSPPAPARPEASGAGGPLPALIDRWRGKRIIVAGDFLLDRYVFGYPARLSREAPVVILEHEGEEDTPGGAGNATRNVGALGGHPIPLGAVGDDAEGERLLTALHSGGIETGALVRDAARRTIAKTRVLAGGVHSAKQQVLRIDQGRRGPAGEAARAALLDHAGRALDVADGVLFSDYGYGTLFPELRAQLLEGARRRGIPMCADSRFELAAFAGVTIATPNEEEAAAAVGIPAATDEEADEAGAALLARLAARAILLTRGSRGMRLFLSSGERVSIPVIGPDEVADVTGAGDTVASAVILGLAAGGDPVDAASVANAAASVVVMKRGAATATPAEVLRAIEAAASRRGEGDVEAS